MAYKLLLADDSITIQKVVSIIFANEECELTIVDNGKSAMEKAMQTQPDIMLVDTLMPEINGYDVCAAVRRDPTLKNTPLLLLTGAFEPFDVDKAKSSGADDFISKPFESQTLIEKVKALVALGGERKHSAPARVEPAAVPTAPVEPVTPPPAATAATAASAWEEDIFAEMPGDGLATTPEVTAGWSGSDPVSGWAIEEPLTEQEELQPVPAEEPAWDIPSPAAEPVVPDAGYAPIEAGAGAVEFAPAEEVVEASPEDDLWGAFALEAVEEEPSGAADIIETYTVQASPSVAGTPDYEYSFSEEHFSGAVAAPTEDFSEITDAWDLSEEPLSIAGTEAAEEAAPVGAASSAPEPASVEEDVFAFGDDDEQAPPAVESTPGEDEYFFGGSVEPPASPAAEPSVTPSPVVEAQPAFVEPASMPSPAGTAGAGAEAPGADGAITLTEAQLAAALSRISREVIERIVWEVVPDLAETLIKEEIRRIKEGK